MSVLAFVIPVEVGYEDGEVATLALALAAKMGWGWTVDDEDFALGKNAQ